MMEPRRRANSDPAVRSTSVPIVAAHRSATANWANKSPGR